MHETNGYSANDDGPVDAALADYLTRRDRGDEVDVEEIVARYPGCEAGLQQFLQHEQNLHHAVARASHIAAPQENFAGRMLGDFRLARVIGCGGMGVVYEALQVSLSRRVALKILPFTSMLDERQLARFKNEARAAATLHHEHIVPIHAVGSDRGVHFYAMQLIDGRSLAQVIEQLRAERGVSMSNETATPATPQSDTQVVAQASTLPDFHSREYWRTIARLGIEAAEALDHAHQNGILHRDIKPGNLLLDNSGKLWITDFGLARMEADAGMTMTGDLLGTLRYMSPEQALAKRVVVDHRSDIYSLGATLYELLTLRPAFGDTDRSILLQRIAFDEPRPPRQIDRHIPVELETIILKAMRKSPEQRYAIAQELADDLQRFLENRPIKAKPPTWREQAVKWSRRHPMAIWAALLFLAATTAVSAVSTVLIANAYNREATQREIAEVARERAQSNLKRASVAIRDVLINGARGVGEWSYLPPELRDKMAEQAAMYYESLVQEGSSDPTLQYETALGLRALGHLCSSRKDYQQSEKLFRQSVGILDRLCREHPNAANYRNQLAFSYWMLSESLSFVGRADEADAAINASIASYQELVTLDPRNIGYWKELWGSYSSRNAQHGDRGEPWKGYVDEEITFFREMLRRTPDNAIAHAYLGMALHAKGSTDEAIAEYREAIRLDSKTERIYGLLADILYQKGVFDESFAVFRQGLQMHPDDIQLRNEFCTKLMERGLLDDYVAQYREAVRLKPTNSAFRGDLGLGLQVKGELDEAITQYREAMRLQPNEGVNHKLLGDALHSKGLVGEATSEYEKAIEVYQKQIKLQPDDVTTLRLLAGVLAACADTRLRDPLKAVQLAEKAVKLAPLEAANWDVLGVAHYRAGNYRESMEALQKREGPGIEAYAFKLSASCLYQAMAEWQLGNHDAAREGYGKAIKWMTDCNQLADPVLGRLRAEAEQLLGVTKPDTPDVKLISDRHPNAEPQKTAQREVGQ